MLPGANESCGSQSHSHDLMLEVILAALPATANKLQREQSIDFGTVLESLKTMFKEREKMRVLLSPFNQDKASLGSDILSKTWEAFASNPSKVFNLDTVLLSASRSTIVELVKQINASGRQFDFLPQVNLAEFKDTTFLYTLDNCSKPEFATERFRRYRSPFLLA